jgi:hypothetical protein
VQQRAGAVDEAVEEVFDDATDGETEDEAGEMEGVADGAFDVLEATVFSGCALADVPLVCGTTTFRGLGTRLGFIGVLRKGTSELGAGELAEDTSIGGSKLRFLCKDTISSCMKVICACNSSSCLVGTVDVMDCCGALNVEDVEDAAAPVWCRGVHGSSYRLWSDVFCSSSCSTRIGKANRTRLAHFSTISSTWY